MRVWRISRPEHKTFDGEGGRLASGRWHHRGLPIVYTSGSLSLAAVEFFVQLPPGLTLHQFVATSADIPDSLISEKVTMASLPGTWRQQDYLERTRDQGSEWLKAMTSAVMAVPSAVIPIESNYLINPRHKHFSRITIHSSEPFEFDTRMWKGVRR